MRNFRSALAFKYFISLAAGLATVSLNSNAFTFNRRQCDLRVNGSESVTFRSRLVREPTRRDGTFDSTDEEGRLRPGYFRYRDRQQAVEYGLKACAALEPSVSLEPGLVENSFSCTAEVLPVAPPKSRPGLFNTVLPDLFENQDDDEIVTYSAVMSYTIHTPALTEQQIAQARLEKIDACLQQGGNDDAEERKLTELKAELEQIADAGSRGP